MAKVIFNSKSKSILGDLSGKLGQFVFGSWKGTPYVRSMPEKVANPRTAAQLAQRAKFAEILKFLKPLTVFLRVGFKSKTANMTAFNAAWSYNYKHTLTGTYPDYIIDYSKALVSLGKLPGALNPTITSTIPGEIEFRWQDNSIDYDASGNDKVMLVVYNPEKQEAVTVIGGHTRKSGSQAITLPSTFMGNEVQCYIGFQNAGETVVSDSRFVGSLMVF